MNDKILIDGLTEIVLYSSDIDSKAKALELLLMVNAKNMGVVKVDLYNIPAKVYKESIKEMLKDNKIMSIKILRDGIIIDGKRLELKEAKILAERISVIEKIPMIKGYEIPEN